MSLAMQRNFRYFTDEEQKAFQEAYTLNVGKNSDGVFVGPGPIELIKQGKLSELRREIAKKRRTLQS